VSAGALAFANAQVAFAVFFFYGMGLGMSMTSTSLLFSDRYGDDRAAKLERLNFVWSGGATLAPLLFLPFLRMTGPRMVFFTMQVLFLILLVWVLVKERHAEKDAPLTEVGSGHNTHLRFLVPLLLMAMCAVGIEAALSGWLATYSHRADLRDMAGPALSVSFFWCGIMLSRLVFSTRLLAMIGRRRVLSVALWGAAASIVLLIGAQHSVPILVASALAGLSMGPLYPLVLSFLLERSPHGWVFAVAGMGSAFLPWLTGLVSAHYGELRYGLIVPCAAAFAMIALRLMSFRGAEPVRP
jgi:FHS family glucose/mannose:H+ symporter-like MFS transporter